MDASGAALSTSHLCAASAEDTNISDGQQQHTQPTIDATSALAVPQPQQPAASADIADTLACPGDDMSVSVLPMSSLYPFVNVGSLGLSEYSQIQQQQQQNISSESSAAANSTPFSDATATAASTGCPMSTEYSGQVSRHWIHAFISQGPGGGIPLPLSSQQPSMPVAKNPDAHGSMSIPNSQPLYKGDVSQAGSSDSDSDDISRSLSILLSQQLQQQQQQPQQGPKRFHTIGLLPHGGDYTNALEDILGFGIDGARRVISMPNPIGNSLPLDMSINAHTQALIGMPVISSLGIEKTASDGSSQDYRLAATSDVAYPQVSAALPTGASDNSPSDGLLCLQSDLCTVPMPVGKPESLAARSRGGGIPSSPLIPETHKAVAGLVGKRDVPTAVSSPEKSTVGKLRGTAMRKPNASTAPPTPRAKRGRPPLVHKQNGTKGASGGPPMLEIKAMDQQSAASDVPLASTLYPADSSSIMVGPSAHQLGIGRCGLPPSGESQPLADSSGCGEPASVDTPRSMHTPSLASSTPTSAVSALIPHRVDRQLAAASRPLLFVRPRSKDDQPRRRKRRCVSSNPAIPLGSAPATVKGGPADALGPPANGALLKGGEAPGSLVADGGQNNLQWQRISEQRRRDAMRENFDLLKRMLPQAYMASDDGRELARPVLLARFLRWVDDTLMEMESLKSEVARLRLVVQGTGQTPHAKTSGVWQQLLGGEAGGVSGLSAPHPHHQLTTVFGQPNNLGLQGPD